MSPRHLTAVPAPEARPDAAARTGHALAAVHLSTDRQGLAQTVVVALRDHTTGASATLHVSRRGAATIAAALCGLLRVDDGDDGPTDEPEFFLVGHLESKGAP